MIIFVSAKTIKIIMGKDTNFFGQPVYGQLIKSLNRDKILEISKKHGGERYVKSFDAVNHLLTMLFAIIMRFDSLRENDGAILQHFHSPALTAKCAEYGQVAEIV